MDAVSRRAFLGATAAGLGLTALNLRTLAKQQPSEQISLAMIGVGGMGRTAFASSSSTRT